MKVISTIFTLKVGEFPLNIELVMKVASDSNSSFYTNLAFVL